MSKYILSTMTSGVNYAFYEGGEIKSVHGKEKMETLPTARRVIHIAGGKGIPSLNSGWGEAHKDDQGYPMWTPAGVITTLTDEQYTVLHDHPLFKKHMESGYLKLINSDISGNHGAVAKIAQTMEQTDGASQLTPDNVKKKVMGLTPSIRTGDADDSWDGKSPTRIKG